MGQKMSKLKFTWDAEVSAAYFYLSENRIAKTISIGSNISIDVDEDGEVVGIEALGVVL
jgi:uncharacterized protein YuzE